MKPSLTTVCLAAFGGTLLAPACSVQGGALDNWATIQLSTNRYGLPFVTYGNGRFVAYGWYSDFGGIYSSEDGRNWTLRSDGGPPSGSGLSYSVALAFTGGRFFAWGGFGSSAVSADGIDWTVLFHATNGLFGSTIGGVTSGAGKYVAVGSANQADLNVFTSFNGIDWTAHSSGSPAGVFLNDIAYGAGLFVALPGSQSDSSHSYTSPNGWVWTQRSIPGGTKVGFYTGIFIIPYGGGTNLLSRDGTNWVEVLTGLTNQIEKPIYANNLLLARAGNYLASSADGTNWVQYSHPLPGFGLGRDVATDGARLVIVDGEFKGSVSFDGFAYLSKPLVHIGMAKSQPPAVVLSGLVGRSYRIEGANTLTGSGAPNWQTLTTLQLPTDPFTWMDLTANNDRRFYRGVLLP